MKCPFCSNLESKVIDSRTGGNADVIRRRRACENCDRRFTTYERVEEVAPLIIKKDGRREPFDRQKLVAGLRRACDKRAVPLASLELAVDTIERTLVELGEKEVSAKLIGEKVMEELRKLDEVAYIRFASVYRSFKDIDEFMVELEKIARKKVSSPSDESRRGDVDAS